MHIGVLKSGRHDSPHIRKSSLDHDCGEKNVIGCKGEEAKRVASGEGHFRRRATSWDCGLHLVELREMAERDRDPQARFFGRVS